MKYRWALASLALVLLGLLPAAAASGQTDKEVQALGEPVVTAVLTGLTNGDYGLYAKFFDQTLKNAIPEKKFPRIRKDIISKFGKYQSHTYLGFLKKGNLLVTLWKGRFSASNDDVLIRLVLSPHDNKVEVAGLWLQ